MKDKEYTIGHLSMNTEAYNKFVSLPKDSQLKEFMKNMSPKNEELAKEQLKNVPNGDNISKGGSEKASNDNQTGDTRGGNKAGAEGRKPSTEKS